MKSKFVVTLTAVLFFFVPFSASAVQVDLELLLLADVSGSISTPDFELQRDGYANAFRSAAVQNAILGSSGTGNIAVSLVYWSDGSQQSLSVPWTLIDSTQSSEDFADAIASAARPFSASTAMASALNYGAGLFADNNFESNRLTIDLSGDGADNIACIEPTFDCTPVQTARDSFLTGGDEVRVINALWIQDRSFFGVNEGDTINALDYGNHNVIGGPNSFQSVVANFTDFAAAIESKLVREITGGNGEKVPEPGTLLLLGSGLAGLALYRRRMNKA